MTSCGVVALFPTTDTKPIRVLCNIRAGLNTMTIVSTYVTLCVVHMHRTKPVQLLVYEGVFGAIKRPFGGMEQFQHHFDKGREFLLGGG